MRRKEVRGKADAINLLWDDGAVVLKDEPLNVTGPKTLLFYRLGLNPRAFVIRRESSTSEKRQEIEITTKQTRNNNYFVKICIKLLYFLSYIA